jgi:hypothetical protein
MADPMTQDIASARTLISLKVTNHNDFAIEDRFDGVPYRFEPEKSVSIPSDAALHMLGWYPGVDLMVVKNHIQKRWGWNTPELVKEKKHDQYFAMLTFKPITYKIVEVPEEVSEAEGEELPNPIKPKPKKNGNTTGLEASA